MLGYLLSGQVTLLGIVMELAVLTLIGFVVFPARGYAQAYIAYKLGDPTAKYNGRLTMNPLRHIDKFGLIVLYVCGLGFIKPVPINYRNFRYPRRDTILCSLAGPAMGLLMGLLGVGVFRILSLFVVDIRAISILYVMFVELFAYYNIALAILTLLPIPFFDGYTILSFFLPPKWVFFIEQNATMVSFVVLVLILSGALNIPLSFLSNLVLRGFLFIFGL